ncbi:MAG: efflux RND transporter permease subunit [Oscillatoriales cyanobacterium RM1_1_9]|nr:efflux RND transporter permease subunit [Oscillatoriales cyanobacterium RM1_1_9]
MTTLFYRNFRLLILTILLILVWGMVAFFTLPRLEDPELVPRVAVVKTFFPGADAGRVEALVTERIEPELDEIEEIKSYESTSKAGSSIIKIELVDQVQQSEVDVIWARVRDRIRQAASQLPPGAMEPELEELEVRAYALIAALTWEQDNPPNYAILNRLAETLKDELAGLPGTEKVEIFGAPPEEITVEIDPIQLTTLGLTAEGLSNQIQQSDAKVSAGQFRSSQNNFSLEVESELDSLERIQTIPIRFGREGQFTQLGDIATVQKTILDPPNELALVEGHPGVSLAVFVESDYQLDQWARSAENQLTEFRQQLGKGVNLEVIFSQSPYVEARLRTLIVNLLLSGLLVFGVTLIMMGWKSALVVGLALPLSSCMVLGLMQQLGIPLHQMSVTGLIVALGLLIDTAIIVVDEVNHHLEAGVQPEIAITQTIQYLLLPLLASTITTILAFVPITALPGSAGEFVGTIGTSVILAVGSSLLISITVIVTLAAKLYQKSPGPVNPLVNPSVNRSSMTQPSWWNRGFSNAHLTQLYRASLKGLFKYPILGGSVGGDFADSWL